jgi:hypothetical protein
MSDPAAAAGLLLTLHQIRTERALRRARSWFVFDFHPAAAAEVLAVWLGPGRRSAPYRMVTSYWDMAASLVTQGAIPAAMFNAANTEHIALYAKMEPFLAEMRAATGYADYLSHVERVVLAMPDAEARVDIFRRYAARQARFARERAARRNPPAPPA